MGTQEGPGHSRFPMAVPPSPPAWHSLGNTNQQKEASKKEARQEQCSLPRRSPSLPRLWLTSPTFAKQRGTLSRNLRSTQKSNNCWMLLQMLMQLSSAVISHLQKLWML